MKIKLLKKPLIFIGGILLVLALVLNIQISFNQSELSEASHLSIQNIAMASAESTNDGSIGIDTESTILVKVHYDPFNPESWTWVECAGHSTDCLLSWPNWGCDEHEFILNTWS